MAAAEVLAIIPARGGSKGISRKNMRKVGGVPLVVRAVQAAVAAGSVTRVVVTTDSDEIARVSRKCGADIVERPVELSGDLNSSESALLHCLEDLEAREGYRPDLTVFIQCTSPLLISEDIDGAVEMMRRKNVDCVFSVARYNRYLWSRDEFGKLQSINHDAAFRPRRQDIPPQFVESGSVYVMNTVSFTKAGFRFGGELEIYEIPGHRNMEVDEETDLFMADAMLSCMNRVKPLENMPSALIMDFDGVFTDNRVLVLQDGTEAVWCSRGDGWGLTMLRKTGLKMLILSTETNPVVGARAKKLGIECIQVAGDKLPVLKEWLRQNGLDIDDVMYVGNDTNDMECILAVGVGVAVSDSVAKIIEAADVVLAHPGGNGAIREVCDLLLSSE